MNRLALITMTAFLTLALSGCGDNVTKKEETTVQPAAQTQPTGTEGTTGTDAPAENKSGQ